MPPRRGRGRPRRGERRIDAAIDHFAAMGYNPRDVRAIVDRLLKTYDIGADAWPLLEEGSYQAVQDLLFEDEEKQQQLLLEHQPKPQEEERHMEVAGQEPPQEEEQQGGLGQEPPQKTVTGESVVHIRKQGLEEDNAPPESNMAMIEVHSEVSAEPDLPDERVEDHLPAEVPTVEVAVQVLRAKPKQTCGTVRPCYGWISESESDDDDAAMDGSVLDKKKRFK